ncbi:MAG: 2-dehydro-3-deoxyphosphooctonate aldolase synthase [Solirubrobacteraceae bacterium]|jgi:2-dehydro-3-deoxyphosphooctonate aldolase (KDO 8-P synthase)|nr:2-dehydro-3-deoxyphosphooctonate aldolase synthase [Solirubrobacteraceae bacterium]
MSTVQITNGVAAGDGAPLLLIAGPCLIEEPDDMVAIATTIRDIAAKHEVGYVFKSSFDKANRSSIDSARGPGLERGLEVLARVRDEVGVPVLTDIHERDQAEPAAAVCAVLQIPAFLCRQTDLLVAAATSGAVVNVKKGQFLSPGEMANVVAKLEAADARGILLTERGTTFGYQNLVVDFRSLPQLRALGPPVVFDATHSIQLPGGLGTSSGGQREFAAHLARAAAAVGIDGLFVEVHEHPDRAPSDGPNMLTAAGLDEMLAEVVAVRGALAP